MRVECEVRYDEEENDDGVLIECTYVTCSRCGHETMSFGTSEASVKRCLALLREECLEGESNFYVAEEY